MEPPGALLITLGENSKLESCKYLVLDEADEMLKMGFIDDIENILSVLPSEKRTFMFSATCPPSMQKLIRKYLHTPKYFDVKVEERKEALVEQGCYFVHEKDRFELLKRIIDLSSDFYGIIFCATRREVEQIHNRLVSKGYQADCLHGDISQKQREISLDRFRKKLSTIIVATDVASRGLMFQI